MKLIKEYLKAGGVVSSVTLEDDKLYYDVNTGMKADMRISVIDEDQNLYSVKTRYDSEERTFEDVSDIVDYAWSNCRCGRDYWSDNMETLAKKFKVYTGVDSIDNYKQNKKKRIAELEEELKKLKNS